MRERQPGRIANGLAQWRTASDLNRTARKPKFREHKWRGVRRVRNSVGVEGSSSVKAPEEHLSTWALEARAPARQVRPRQSLRGRVTLDSGALRVESRYSIIGAHPKLAVIIFQDAAHCIAGQTIAARVDGKRTRLRVKLVQPVLGTHPHRARAIEVHRVHPVVAQAEGTIHVVLERD